MGGSPLISFLIICLLLSLFAVPLRRISEKEGERAEVVLVRDGLHPGILTVKMSQQPLSAVVSVEGKPLALWRVEDGPEWRVEGRFPLGEMICEMGLEVVWPAAAAGDGAEHAVQVMLALEGMEEQKETFWAGEKLDELLHFTWKGAQP